jgi:hypothetical protein
MSFGGVQALGDLDSVDAGEARARDPVRVASRATRVLQLPDLLFLVLLVLAPLPLWMVAHVPTQDGASHVETVSALLRLPHSALLQREYLANFGLQPNWLAQLLFAGLLQVASPGTAEKMLLTGYVLLLPVAFRLALPRTERGRWAALGAFPFVHSFAFHMGFWNFCYGLALFFLVLAAWQRWSRRWSLGRGLAFASLLVVTYFAHSVATSSALAAITAVLGWHALLGVHATWRRAGRRARWARALLRRAVPTYLAASPAALLLAAFFLRQRSSFPVRPTAFDYAKHLGTLYALVSFDLRELVLTVPVAAALGGTLVVTLARRRRRWLRPSDAWLCWALLATLLYFASPDAVIDGAQISDRLALLPWMALALWIGSGAVGSDDVRRVALVLLLVTVAGTGWRIAKYRQLDAYLADYATVTPHVPEGSVILPLTFAPAGPRQGGAVDGRKLLSYRIEVARHLAGLVATERHGVNLGNSQANTRHAPLVWRPERNPFMLLDTRHAGLEDEPPCVELWPYTRLAGPIDAVLLWGVTPQGARERCGAAVLRELRAGWERVFVSPQGTAQLFLRRER